MSTETLERDPPFLSEVERAAERIPAGPSWLGELRAEGLARFRQTGFPGPRDEAWRFTSLKPLLRSRFSFEPVPGSAWSIDDVPPGVEVQPLTASLAEDPRWEALLGGVVRIDRHPLVALNTALLEEPLVVRAPAGAQALALRLVHRAPAGDPPPAVSPRLLVVAEEGAELTLIEEYTGGEDATWTHAVTEVYVGRNAVVRHLRVQGEGASAFHTATAAVRVDRNGRYASHVVSYGGRLARLDLDVVLEGEGAETTLDGLYFVSGRQHTDHHTHVDHASPHTQSRELYRGILDGRSTAVFNGRVLIRPDAQKVEAAQTNNNLLLSTEALVNTNPELEIFADDVKAAHGATIGQLDEDHLFYLRSRGIGQEEAKSILVRAFAGAMLERLPVPSLAERLGRTLEERL